jgi:hypothetical protein
MVESEVLKIIVRLEDMASDGLFKLNRALSSTLTASSPAIGGISGIATNISLLKTTIAGAALPTAFGAIRAGLAGVISHISLFRTAIMGISLAYLAKSFLATGKESEGYRTRLKLLLGSTEEANQALKNASDLSKEIAVDYDALQKSSTDLAEVISGGSAEIKKYLPIIADIAAVTEMSVEEVTAQVKKMYISGTGAAIEFQRNGVLAMMGFKKGVNYSVQDTRKMMIDAWNDPQSRFRGAAAEMSKTWDGLTTMLGSRWKGFQDAVMDSGLFDYVKSAVKVLLTELNKVGENGTVEDWAKKTGDAVISMMKKAAIGAAWIGESFRGLKMAGLIVWTAIGYVDKGIAHLVRGSLTDIDRVLALLQKMFTWLSQAPGVQSGVWDTTIESIGKWRKSVQSGIAGTTETIDGFNSKIDMALKQLTELADETPVPDRVKALLAEIDKEVNALKKAEEIDDKKKRPPLPTPDEKGQKVTAVDRMRAEMEQVSEVTKTYLAGLDAEYDKEQTRLEGYFGDRKKLSAETYEKEKFALESYFTERKRLAQGTYDYELEQLTAIADAIPNNKKLDKEKAILDIYKRQQEFKREMISLELDETKAIDERTDKEEREREAAKEGAKNASDILRDAKERAATTGEKGLNVEFASELADLESQQREENDRLLEIKKEGYATEEQMQELHNSQMLEKEKLLADQRRRIEEQYVNGLKGIAGNMSSAFNDLFQATGSKNKSLFEAYKIASIAETTISTYQSAQEAYKSLVGLPVVGPGLAVAAAAAAIAAGLARIAVIRAQKMARGGIVWPKQGNVQSLISGGVIGGYSPNDRADNVPIAATAGEFMQPVGAVRYYGVNAMDALRRMAVPREILAPYLNPHLPVPMNRHLAMGGLVTDAAMANTSYSISVPVTTIDTMDGLVRKLKTAIEESVIKILDRELA